MLRRLLVALTIFLGAFAATAADDSCTIAVTPAATLLLPYFEAGIGASTTTTLFSIINTSQQPQIARVTLWTDWAFPACSFDVSLGGYGVTSINLRDLFVSGRLPSTARSDLNFTNPNHRPEMTARCALRPDVIPPASLADLQSIFTTGRPIGSTSGCDSSVRLGGAHTDAIGYATIDVVANCSTLTPNDAAYFTTDLLFDNVLTGDYQLISPTIYGGNDATGSPLVHTRAVPEGGPAGTIAETKLPFTFYDRFTKIGDGFPRTIDRRQALPSTFAARFVRGTAEDFGTSYLLWREGYTAGGAACARYVDNSSQNGTEVIRFDEHENSFTIDVRSVVDPVPISYLPLPATSSVRTESSLFPLYDSADAGGWMYINLGNGGSPAYSSTRARQSQNWIVVKMTAEGRYAAMWDAAPLGNGCSISPAP